MKRLLIISTVFFFAYSCQALENSQSKRYQERIQRVTPTDIQNHARKILIQEYGYEWQEEEEAASSVYLETSWKNQTLTEDEKELGWENVRVRFKIRSRETRSGPTNEYNVHSLLFSGEVQSYREVNGSSQWVRAEITPQRKDSLEEVYDDFKLEFDSGNVEFKR